MRLQSDDVLEHRLKVLPRAVVRTEVREEQRVGIPREDLLLAVAPGLDVDVGRRRGRHHVGARAAADARRVADERDARRGIEVRDVMRRVPRRVRHLDLASGHRQRLAPFDDRSRAAGTGFTSPHNRSMFCAVEPSRAGQQLRGIDEVRRAAPCTITSMCGMLLENGPDRAGSDRGGCASPGSGARRRTGCPSSSARTSASSSVVAGPGSTSATPAAAVQDRRRDDLGTAEEVEIDVVEAGGKDGHHGKQSARDAGPRSTAPDRPVRRGFDG